jgi:hypothetical protein
MSAAAVPLKTRITKMRAMSISEVIGRLRYSARIRWERSRYRVTGQLANRGLQRSLRSDLGGPDWKRRLLSARRSSSARFFPGAHEVDRFKALFEDEYRREYRDALEHAALARAQTFQFFGREFSYDQDIDWHADPVTYLRWPQIFHADVPVHKGDVGFGDVKHVWELNRHQFLIDLAKAYAFERQETDLKAIRRVVRSWVDQNPYGVGVNWSCALEPAFRSWSWLWAYHLTADALDDDFHLQWLAAFHDHGHFLARHMEHYSSPFNHLIGEAAALFALGCCFPEFNESASWRERGRKVLEGRLSDQFYVDGGSAEQSTFYHHATTGFYLLAVLIGRANGQEFSTAVWAAIERAIEFSTTLSRPDGMTPEIGGADDGKPIRMEHLPLWDFRPYQAIGAVLFQRADFKAVAGRFFEDALWLLGTAGETTFNELSSEVPRATAVVLPASGYVVARSAWSDTADYVCFDIGEQAAGMRTDAVPNSMHGHADCLSVIACLNGRRVLVDSGLYGYNCGGAWETHFRETVAHNTARVDDRDQARHIHKMAWSHSYRATIESFTAPASGASAVGSHDGYSRGAAPVTHRRAVWLRPGGYLLIYDQFSGTGDHTIELNYQFAPGTLEPTSTGVLFDSTVDIVWASAGSWAREVRCGGPNPEDGWICSSLGCRHAAPRLLLRGAMHGAGTAILTILVPRSGVAPRVHLVHRNGGSIATIKGRDYTDVVTAAAVSIDAPVRSDGFIAVCRLRGQQVVDSAGVGSTFVEVDPDRLRQTVECMPPELSR